jgi:malate dehydrogenase (oxaloacetate-decarboxylating)(NADP+)
MFIAAARAVADRVTQSELDVGLIYPHQSTILETELHAAERIAEVIFASNLATVPAPEDIAKFIRSQTYKPEYRPLI